MTYYEELVQAACDADLRNKSFLVQRTAESLPIHQAHGAYVTWSQKYGPESKQRRLRVVGSADQKLGS